jgi:hypothetical protein
VDIGREEQEVHELRDARGGEAEGAGHVGVVGEPSRVLISIFSRSRLTGGSRRRSYRGS